MKPSRPLVSWILLVGGLTFSGAISSNDAFDEMDRAFEELERERTSFQEIEQYAHEENTEFQAYKKRFLKEFEQYKNIYQEESARFVDELALIWAEPRLSDAKVWVDYSDDLQSRSEVDFENRTISVSVANGALEPPQLKNALKTLLLKNKAQAFQEDRLAQAVESRSKKEISSIEVGEVQAEPILLPFVSEQNKLSDDELNALVERMLRYEKRQKSRGTQGQDVVTVIVPFDDRVNDASRESSEKETDRKKVRKASLPKAARALESKVSVFAKQAKIDPALVYAVIETESAFNPMAKSPVPAYGLMQIVPGTAGQDATAKLFGKPRILAPSYLYNSGKNIEVGTTYLNILYYSYLKDIKNDESRLYSAIAAYNTGAGNVARAFTGRKQLKPAIEKINRMTPEQVYQYLVNNLPYEETRRYLVKVRQRMLKYGLEG